MATTGWASMWPGSTPRSWSASIFSSACSWDSTPSCTTPCRWASRSSTSRRTWTRPRRTGGRSGSASLAPGAGAGGARSELGIETLVAFRPERLLDFARFERYATSLGLDPPLRFKAAEEVAAAPAPGGTLHKLEAHFDLSSRQILDIITRRHRLEIAVRGGVAEHHLQGHLEGAGDVRRVGQIDQDGQPDFDVTLASGLAITVECKNVSPVRRADGTIKVEVQKTRASKGDPRSRFYRRDQFDVVAACLWPVTGRWEYRFKATSELEPHKDFPERVAPIQLVDDSWSDTISDALG